LRSKQVTLNGATIVPVLSASDRAKKAAGDASAETHTPRRNARTSLESYLFAGYVQSGVSSEDWRAMSGAAYKARRRPCNRNQPFRGIQLFKRGAVSPVMASAASI